PSSTSSNQGEKVTNPSAAPTANNTPRKEKVTVDERKEE
ncbi:hypothetical protein CVT24_009750, partial [Panaeolus cyanescens]